MRLKRKPLFATALLALSLAACGPKTNNDSSSSEQASANTSDIVETSTNDATSLEESSTQSSEESSSSESESSISSEIASSSASSSSSETTPVTPGGDKGGDKGGTGDTGKGGTDKGGTGTPGSNDKENDINFSDYSTLPAINVTTDYVVGSTEERQTIESLEDYTSCKVSIDNCDDTYKKTDLTAGIRLRGNSTAGFVKKPYRIKFEGKQNLLGLNNGNRYKSWVLLADWNDYTYSRNYFSLHLGNALPNMEFSPDSKHVEVFINGQYKGIYLLTEQVQAANGRVSVDLEGQQDATIADTGFLLELEASTTRRANEGEEGKAWFKVDGYAKNGTIDDSYKVSDYTVAYYVVKSDARSEVQMEFIKNYMTSVYDAIYKTKDRDTIESLIDINSAIDMYFIQLLANDGDGNYSSIYCYKDAGGKLKFGPPWDFDNSYMGSTNSTTFYHLLNDLYKNYTWFSSAVKEKIKEYFKDDGLVAQVWNATKAEAETHRAAVEEREYVKWRDEKYGYTCLGTQYASFTAALNGLNDWLVSHKSWIGSSYNIDFNS